MVCFDIDDQVNFLKELSCQVDQWMVELNLMNEDLKYECDFVEIIFDLFIDIMIVYSKDFIFLVFNCLVERFYGKMKQEVIGKNLFEVFFEVKGKFNIDDLMCLFCGELIYNFWI